MRYLRARFTGYIGFYNGMNMEVIDIDFSKCTHNIVLIIGGNGSGKSTLLEHLNLFPDSSSSFVPTMDGEKFLVLADGQNIYEIKLVSLLDRKTGGRKTTKAYIRKNGMELNENGNVSSYKDIIFSEFELDSNYISLTSLSSTDRGLGDKTPAERKKYTSNIINNLETYNNIYKTLNKKSLVLKSNINNLHTKIQNIGDKDLLENQLNSLRSKEQELNNKIMQANNRIVSIQAKNSVDEDEAREMQNIISKKDELENQLNLLKVNLDSYAHKTKIMMNEIESKLNGNKELLSSYKSKLDSVSSDWRNKSQRFNDVCDNINSIKANISSSLADNNIGDKYKESNDKIKELRSELLKLNLNPDSSNIFELTNLLSFYNKFISNIDSFYDGLNNDDCKLIVEGKINDTIKTLQSDEEEIIAKIESVKTDIIDLQSKIKITSVLDNRPSKCNIDSCPFVSEAISIDKKYDRLSLVDDLDEKQALVLSYSDMVTKIQKSIDYLGSLLPKQMQFGVIRESILENSVILEKYDKDLLTNFESKLVLLNQFNDQRDSRRLVDGLNLLKLLESETTENEKLEIEYNNFREKVQLINSSKSILEGLEKEKEELLTSIPNLKSEIDSYNSLISSLSDNIDTELEYYNLFKRYSDIESDYKIYKSKVDDFSKKSEKSIDSIKEIDKLKADISNLSFELNPIIQNINTISGQLTLLDSYYTEYNDYKSQFDLIETVKKYCSPTGGGIQTIFMQIYMSKTLKLSNQILSMLFNGEYQLLEFVINENEFRIPFIGNGLPVDDISSGSSSQICIMGMIINLVLLHQASTKFNIARLDEIDGPLDTSNRFEFINALYKTMPLLGIEQLFLISHSIEADIGSADVIRFKTDSNYEPITNSNVIYDYNSEYEKTLQ